MRKHGPLPLLLMVAIAPEARSESRQAPVLDMLPGVVEARQAVDLALPIPGALAEISVSEMESVEQGQVLAALDDRLARASLFAAQAVANRNAHVRRAQSAVALAEKYLERVRGAYEKNAASGLELDEAQGRLAEAQAGLAAAQEQQREADAQVALEQVQLDSHQLRAPFAGIVTRILVKPGATVSPDKPILRLTNAKCLRVSLFVPVEYFHRLRVGRTYTLDAEPPAPRRVEAQLMAYEPIVDAASDTFRCVFQLENEDLSIPAGVAVRLCEPDLGGSSAQQR